MRDIRHFIDGAAFEGVSGRFSDVFDPNTGEVQARVQLATAAEVDRAVQAAQNAFDGWSRIARLGIRVGGDEGAPLDGEGGRLALGTACDRNTGMIYECIVVRDAWNENHIACLLDGDGAAIAAKE